MSIPVETFFMDDSIEGNLQSRIQQIIAAGIKSIAEAISDTGPITV